MLIADGCPPGLLEGLPRLSELLSALRRDATGRAAWGDRVLLARARVSRLPGGLRNLVYGCVLDGHEVCVKLHRPDGQRARREWDALCLLAGHGHPAVPRPLACDPAPRAPAVVMSLVPGHGLGEQDLTGVRAEPLARVLRAVHAITPVDSGDVRVSRAGRSDLPADGGTSGPEGTAGEAPGSVGGVLPVRLTARGMLDEVTTTWTAWTAGQAAPGQRAQRTGLHAYLADQWTAWHEGPDPGVLAARAPVVFGQGDPNLSNCLWDGGRVRLVDFEYAGWSDAAYELALLIEHVQSRDTPDHVWRAFVNAYRPDPGARRRLTAARRLVAWFWLAELHPADSSAAGEGRFAVQARRTLHLLGDSGIEHSAGRWG